MGILFAIAGCAGHFVLLEALGIDSLSLGTTLTYKTLYGAALSWLATPWALQIAFTDQAAKP